MKYFLFAAMAISIGAIPAGGAPPPEMTPPRLIVLDSLAHFYEPVRFDHQLHIDYARLRRVPSPHHRVAGHRSPLHHLSHHRNGRRKCCLPQLPRYKKAVWRRCS